MIRLLNELDADLDKVKALRLRGRFSQGWKASVGLARRARQAGSPRVELSALWEALDCGKVLSPERVVVLQALARRAGVLARASADRRLIGEAAVRDGALLRVFGRNRKALSVLRRAVALPAVKADRSLHAYALWNMGFASRMEMDLKAARRYFESSRRGFSLEKDRFAEAFACCGLAGVARLSGDARKSLALYAKAAVMFGESGDLYGRAYSNCGQGNALRRLGRWREALAYYRKARELYARLGDRVNEGYVLWGMMVCLERLGDPAWRRVLRRAAVIFKRSGDHRGRALLDVWAKGSPADTTARREAAIS
ncbi:MAG: tetratricopeptide repeat protein [Elusimicrobiota bacterium]